MNANRTVSPVRSLRLRLGLSQSSMAKRLGVSLSTYTAWEHRKCRTVDLAYRILSLETEARDDARRKVARLLATRKPRPGSE